MNTPTPKLNKKVSPTPGERPEATTAQIPKQLQNPDYRFALVQPRKKIPCEKGWPENSNYRFDEKKLIGFLENGWNYGVVCGKGNLVVIDADTPELDAAVVENLPETFTVKTGRGAHHFYYICKDLDRPIRLNKDGKNCGDVQGVGKMVVGAGSRHPNGSRYEVANGLPIAEVKSERIRFALRDFAPVDVEQMVGPHQETTALQLSDVLDTSKMQRRGDELQGAHPIHGSDGGQNFTANLSKNCWHCFRCDSGGGALQWLAVQEGLINCSEAGPGSLKGELFKKVLKVAREKYGLKQPESSTQEFFDDGGRVFVPKRLADKITAGLNCKCASDSKVLYVYSPERGIYEDGEAAIREAIAIELQDKHNTHRANEVVYDISARNYFNLQDSQPDFNLICLKNGIYNLQNGNFGPHSPDYLFLSALPVEYDQAADCPQIKKFLREILTTKDIEIIEELFGYLLLRDYPIQTAFLFIGDGRNGKSTLLNLMRSFLGNKNVSSVKLQDLDSNAFATAQLFGKSANIFADLPDRALCSTGTFKALTGKDLIPAQRKFKEPFQFENYAKMLFSCNKVPESKDDTGAFWSRWVLLNFPNVFVGKADKKGLIKELTTPQELSGLFNLATAGLKRLMERGEFPHSLSIAQTRDKYVRASNPIQAFAESGEIINAPEEINKETGKIIEGGYVLRTDVYERYILFCMNENLPRKDSNYFSRKLPEFIPNAKAARKRINGNQEPVWYGITLKSNETEKKPKGGQKKITGD